MIIPELKNLKGRQFTEDHFRIHFNDFYNFLNTNYPDDISFSEKMYWYYNNINTYPLCPVCGKRLKLINVKEGYRKTCSSKCSNSNPEKIELSKHINLERWGGQGYGSKKIMNKIKQTNLERYGVECASSNKDIQLKQKNIIIERYGGQGNASPILKKKQRETMLERYGIENILLDQKTRERIKQTNLERYGSESYSSTQECREKIRQTNLERYGVSCYTQSKEYKLKSKETNIRKFGVEHYSKSDEYKKRMYNTKKQNNSFNTSKIEEDFASYLDSNSINYIRQYKNEKYPFNCDFYLPEKDIYLEINGTWTHGPHPFNPDNQEDLLLLNLWKEKQGAYTKAIETWTITDPHKVQVAQENGIQLYVFYGHTLENLINFCKEKNIL